MYFKYNNCILVCLTSCSEYVMDVCADLTKNTFNPLYIMIFLYHNAVAVLIT